MAHKFFAFSVLTGEAPSELKGLIGLKNGELFGMNTVTGIGNSRYGEYLRMGATEKAYWEGRAAEKLNLWGKEADKVGMKRALEGKNPIDGESLRARKIHSKRNGEGKIVCHGKALYDCVLSPPKSFSVARLWDGRLEMAHRAGVRYAVTAMETNALVRVRKDGADHNRLSGNLLYSQWHHEASRSKNLDPLRHTHVAIINMTFDPVEERWKALQAGNFLEDRNRYGEIYRFVAGQEVERMGYRLRDRIDGGWEIRGIPEKVLEKYSSRSLEKFAAIDGFREHHGREPTGREKQIIVRNHRENKVDVLDWNQWKEGQKERLSIDEYRAVMEVRERALEHSYWVDLRGGGNWVRQEQIGERYLLESGRGGLIEGNSSSAQNFSPLENSSPVGKEKAIDQDLLAKATLFAFGLEDHVVSEPAMKRHHRPEISQSQSMRM